MTPVSRQRQTVPALDKHLFLSLVIPALFLGITGLIKSVVKREVFWSNFYLGIDIALTAFANGIINVVDLSRGLAHPEAAEIPGFAGKMYYNAIILILSFGALLVVMFIHQRLESAPAPASTPPSTTVDKNRRMKRGIWLGIIANGIGAGSLSVFIIARLKGML